MKMNYIIIGIILTLACADAAPSISLQKFEKLNEDEREQAILKAPANEKEELLKAHIHISLLEQFRGEKGLSYKKELAATQKRGFLAVEALFYTQYRYWASYNASLAEPSARVGMTVEEQQTLRASYAAMLKRRPVVHDLAFRLAASPAALILEKRIEALNTEWKDKLDLILSKKREVTKEELDEVDSQANEVFEELNKLPKLTPEQAQKEYDEFPERLMFMKVYPDPRY